MPSSTTKKSLPGVNRQAPDLLDVDVVGAAAS
jgi:hypothetical protein